MERVQLSRLILLFSVLFFVLLVSPAFLNMPLIWDPLLKIGDLTDLFTPVILLPIYFLLFQLKPGSLPKKELVFFVIFAACFAQGQGMHLSANSIGHLLESGSTPISRLTYFYDEFLSHYIWFFGINGLTALLIYRQYKNPFEKTSKLTLEIIAGIMYGVTFFITGIEGQTAPLSIPFALMVTLFGLIYGWGKLKTMPLLLFFLIAHILALILFLIWGTYWGGLPQFSDLGLI